MKILSTSILLTGVAAASAKHSAPFLKARSGPALMAKPETKSLLEIRGGGIDPKLLTNTLTYAGLAQGFVSLEAPEVNIDMYGGKDKSPLSIYFTRLAGAGVLSIGVIAFCLFTMDQDPMKALGWGSLVWTVEKASTLLNKVHDELGDNANLDLLWSVINIGCVYACFSGVNWGRNFLLGVFGLLGVNCILGIFSNKTNAEVYGHDPENMNDEQLQTIEVCCYDNLALAVFVISLLLGVDSHQAFGYMSLPVIALCIRFLLGGDVDEQCNKLQIGLWLLLHGANFLTLGLKK